MIDARPIRFNDQMVLAIMTGRKTQTRRFIDPQPRLNFSDVRLAYGGIKKIPTCPYGQPGDLLWVREVWAKIYDVFPFDSRSPYHYEYRADSGSKYPGEWPNDAGSDPYCPKWKPSHQMPRQASRILLKIINVKAERVQDISEKDARAEGVVFSKDHGGGYRVSFVKLWNYLNKDEHQFPRNPWVWVIEFKVIVS